MTTKIKKPGGSFPKPKIDPSVLAERIRTRISDPDLQAWVASVVWGDCTKPCDELTRLMDAYNEKHTLTDDDLHDGLEIIEFPNPKKRAYRGVPAVQSKPTPRGKGYRKADMIKRREGRAR